MTPPKIIGIRGKKGAGKDFAYGCIFQLLTPSNPLPIVQKVAFADALKKEVAAVCGVSVDFIDAHKDNFRLILQGWGTNFRRQLHGDNYWISKWLKHVQNYQSMVPSSIVVATDCRFKNEIEAIESMGGVMIQIVATNKEHFEIDTHPSEVELDSVPCKIVLQNDFNNKRALYDSLRTQLIKLGFQLR